MSVVLKLQVLLTHNLQILRPYHWFILFKFCFITWHDVGHARVIKCRHNFSGGSGLTGSKLQDCMSRAVTRHREVKKLMDEVFESMKPKWATTFSKQICKNCICYTVHKPFILNKYQTTVFWKMFLVFLRSLLYYVQWNHF